MTKTWLGGLLVMGLCMGVSCERPAEGWILPDDAVIDRESELFEVVRTGYENPRLAGYVDLDLSELSLERTELPGSLVYDDRQTYEGPVRVRFHGTGWSEPAYLQVDRAPLDLEWTFRVEGPMLSLPMGGASVPLFLMRNAGSEPDLILPRFFALDPSVLVLPVHATVFAHSDGRMPYLNGGIDTAQPILEQLFDPGGSVAADPVPGATSRYALAEFESARPDALWHQCGIQFHLEEVEAVPTQNHANEMLNSENPCARPSLLSPYLRDPEEAGGVPMYVGGEMRERLLGDYAGASCPLNSRHEFVAVQGGHLLTAGITAHEFGHFLGLDHTSDPANLMTPPGPTMSILGTELSAGQCEIARCRAAELLHRLDRVSRARVDVECRYRDSVCGDGEVEGGEVCDDGNEILGDGCRPDCTAEVCGDGLLDEGEACDPGPGESIEDCTATCMVCDSCNYCGDGVVGDREFCDDGRNGDDSDGCTDECRSTII